MAEAGQIVKGGFRKAIGAFFEYDTPKIVHIRSKTVGLINRFIQLVILTYIIGYAIVWEKGYQESDNVVSATTTKLKGVTYINSSALGIKPIPGITDRIWDVSDYVIPPQESDAFFVTTNVVVTNEQTQGECPEDPSMVNVNCTTDGDCIEGTPVINGNGVRTGKCNIETNTCMIYAWCPVENDTLPLPGRSLFEDAKNFTVLIKNNIEFPHFNVTRRNIIETQNPDYLKKCHFSSSDETDRLCPIFYLETIVKEAGIDFDAIAVAGGVLSININWDCNLDHSVEKCLPQYKFTRLDRTDAKIAKGWNFRYANYYEENNVTRRDLVKAYGLRFIIKVTGEAGKFSIVPLLLNLGSGMALLAVATVLCDIVVLYILKKGPFYQEKKYQNVVDDDAFQVSPGSPISTPQQSYDATSATDPVNTLNRRGGARSNNYERMEED